ncbi:type II toxin-antitoxin system SpoIISA family toxin (plasmid) [Lysinibacillus sp. MHQ-1]|nr:type II toxin-antitoxin system SpoIISA family toxin [Lysinibacillus sp. MHQ-1]
MVFILLKPDKYVEEQQFIRRFFYFIFVVFLIAGVLTEEIDITDWKILTVFIIFSVFVDLTILQTPDITKFWNAEFQQSSYIKRTIQKK